MSFAAPVNNDNLVLRCEYQRSQYVYDQMAQAVNADTVLTDDQKQIFLQAISNKIQEMLLNREFYQGIPVRIAIGGNQFNIIPPAPIARTIERAIIGGLAGGAAAVFAATYPPVAVSSVATTVALKCVGKKLKEGGNPCGLGKLVLRLEERYPKIKDCIDSNC
ncbi:MAG TPA: hypothetical protein VLE89_04710 [Chlamydiales bacterium]|nr:hypothetical protein [Chlamydiales bacterium]